MISPPKSDQSGFTLIEAMVSMAIFAVGFAGLYMFYSMSQTTIINADKKLYLSLVADSIVETIANESRRASSDPLNPFVKPENYDAYTERRLENCGLNSSGDARKTWCDNLVNTVGPFNNALPNDKREVRTRLDSGSLLIDVALVSDSGAVSVYLSRRIRP